MRHRKDKRQLNCAPSHRRAMFSNMTVSLIEHEEIVTTLTRAKRLRGVVEPLITLAANDSVASRRRAFSKLRDRSAVHKLFADLGPHYKNRPGGYLRILKHGFRKGDNAPLAWVGLVGRPKPEADAEATATSRD